MNETTDFILFLGRFHPLVVHLPIGFLFFAFLLELYGKWKNTPALTAAIPLALLSGVISAAVACILGYMLSLGGDYSESTLDIHFWFGIATTIITFLAWLIRVEKINISKPNSIKSNISLLTLIVVLLSITGHYGGNLTHGSDYLTKYAPFGKVKKQALAPLAKVEDANIYSYLVNPILENKCTSCHNTDKKKGGLMLHDSISILKGGKNGEVLIAGNASKSELIRRVLLEPHHDDFMPPEGKTPLTEEEITILSYWIDNANADFNSNVGTVKTPETVLEIASNMLGLGEKEKGEIDLPTMGAIDDVVLNDILSEGFNLRELVYESNLYEVLLPPNTIIESNTNQLDVKLQKLSKIKDHILWLYIEDNLLNDSHMKVINQFQNLQKIVISKNHITDAGISEIKNLSNLSSINLYKTAISKKSLDYFSKMKNLKKVYAWQTNISEKDLETSKSERFFEVIVKP
ncbi:DUF2231 domain-containing protein [Flavivirga algicola]|uniref:Cytochrome c domain-containing protein n=1 Tax=Flavivirga algicola TaxID=2729136 RepID=A0ABX1RTC3_9FLAO|nr:DUF2231 domain-containing protein [Flavivirga algicola]NMH86023.1 hypothetical protein [Flavivirga algicola]